MAQMNRIQFQPGMSIDQFMGRYGTQVQCEKALEKVRWRHGFVCPMCARKRALRSLARQSKDVPVPNV